MREEREKIINGLKSEKKKITDRLERLHMKGVKEERHWKRYEMQKRDNTQTKMITLNEK